MCTITIELVGHLLLGGHDGLDETTRNDEAIACNRDTLKRPERTR